MEFQARLHFIGLVERAVEGRAAVEAVAAAILKASQEHVGDAYGIVKDRIRAEVRLLACAVRCAVRLPAGGGERRLKARRVRVGAGSLGHVAGRAAQLDLRPRRRMQQARPAQPATRPAGRRPGGPARAGGRHGRHAHGTVRVCTRRRRQLGYTFVEPPRTPAGTRRAVDVRGAAAHMPADPAVVLAVCVPRSSHAGRTRTCSRTARWATLSASWLRTPSLHRPGKNRHDFAGSGLMRLARARPSLARRAAERRKAMAPPAVTKTDMLRAIEAEREKVRSINDDVHRHKACWGDADVGAPEGFEETWQSMRLMPSARTRARAPGASAKTDAGRCVLAARRRPRGRRV